MKVDRRLIIMLCSQITGLLFAAILTTITMLSVEKGITETLMRDE